MSIKAAVYIDYRRRMPMENKRVGIFGYNWHAFQYNCKYDTTHVYKKIESHFINIKL